MQLVQVETGVNISEGESVLADSAREKNKARTVAEIYRILFNRGRYQPGFHPFDTPKAVSYKDNFLSKKKDKKEEVPYYPMYIFVSQKIIFPLKYFFVGFFFFFLKFFLTKKYPYKKRPKTKIENQIRI